MTLGSRGPFFCIVSLVIFHWAVKKDENGKLRWNLGKNLTIGMGILAISTFFRDVMFSLTTLLHWFGIYLNVIDKFVRKAVETGDMSNGRKMIYAKCMEEIPEKPFFGHGMDLFEHNTDFIYPHNFILQIFYDGGLMLTLILLVPVIWYMIKKIRFGSYETYSMTIFLLFVSVPGALMSSDLWQNERLWLFFGAMLSTSFIYKAKRKYKP
jgi:O-antigen ligase